MAGKQSEMNDCVCSSGTDLFVNFAFPPVTMYLVPDYCGEEATAHSKTFYSFILIQFFVSLPGLVVVFIFLQVIAWCVYKGRTKIKICFRSLYCSVVAH